MKTDDLYIILDEIRQIQALEEDLTNAYTAVYLQNRDKQFKCLIDRQKNIQRSIQRLISSYEKFA